METHGIFTLSEVTDPRYLDLARIIHTIPTTARHTPVTTTFRLVRVLNVLPEYASGLDPARALS